MPSRDDSPTSRRPPPASKKDSRLRSYANAGLGRRLQDGYLRLSKAAPLGQSGAGLRKAAREAAAALDEDLLMSVNPSKKRQLVDPLQIVTDDPSKQSQDAQMFTLELIGAH